MEWVLLLSVVSVLWGRLYADDACIRPGPRHKLLLLWECCTFPRDVIPDGAVYKIKKCFTNHHQHEGLELEDQKDDHLCSAECGFAQNNLLDSNKELNRSAILGLFSTTGISDLQPVLLSSVNRCFSSYTRDVDPSKKCKSGSWEFLQCFMRETFLKCPASLWVTNSYCDNMKVRVIRCPSQPMVLMPPPRE
ncbi:uncharacterized protein LOC124364668 [Homalodisca vitripennis]|uniref:uncharacterized protein LOC124364668 n=1 Tax=Homalodisca vitripennis TaxID=197043 RepID=UPI001EE9F0EF|nr:uncharacterized protein LOC124364668 [Homalodisca vitripennis]